MLESDDAIQEDTVFMGIAIVLMLIYVALALGRMSWVEGRILLACSVMMVVGFSLGTATIFTFFIYLFFGFFFEYICRYSMEYRGKCQIPKSGKSKILGHDGGGGASQQYHHLEAATLLASVC